MHNYGHEYDNPTFVGDAIYTIPGESRRNITQFYPGRYIGPTVMKNGQPSETTPTQFQVHDAKEKQHRLEITRPVQQQKQNEKMPETQQQRDSWGKGIEFLLSCIAMSVGLGNIWR